MIELIDACSLQLSQGPIDWEAVVLSGVEGVYWKSSQYSSTWDHTFDQQTELARKAGLRVGAYHFCSQASNPYDQMKFFHMASSGLGKDVGDLPPMLDWEFCSVLAPINCVTWLVEAYKACQRLWYPDTAERILDGSGERKTLIYTYPDFSSRHQPYLAESGIERVPLAIANYGVEKGKPMLPKPWTDWTIHQYVGNGGRVDGIKPDCDRSVFNGDRQAWDAFCGINRPAGISVLGKAAIDDIDLS